MEGVAINIIVVRKRIDVERSVFVSNIRCIYIFGTRTDKRVDKVIAAVA